jgi:hypothetical protein
VHKLYLALSPASHNTLDVDLEKKEAVIVSRVVEEIA